MEENTVDLTGIYKQIGKFHELILLGLLAGLGLYSFMSIFTLGRIYLNLIPLMTDSFSASLVWSLFYHSIPLFIYTGFLVFMVLNLYKRNFTLERMRKLVVTSLLIMVAVNISKILFNFTHSVPFWAMIFNILLGMLYLLYYKGLIPFEFKKVKIDLGFIKL